MSGPRMVLLAGQTHSGKSTLLARALEALPSGLKLAGFLAPGLWGPQGRSGFDLLDLSSGATVPLARKLPAPPDGGNVPYEFFAAGMEAGRRALDPAICAAADLVVVDEVGKLEMRGLGWAPMLPPLLELTGPAHLWVVRNFLVNDVCLHWNLGDPPVVSAQEPDAASRLAELIMEAIG